MVSRIHVIDPDIGRRVKVFRELSHWNVHVEIYEDLEEFRQSSPTEGFVFAADGTETAGAPNLLDALRTNRIPLPVIMYAEHPATGTVVSAMRSGAFDYLQWPFDAQSLGSAFGYLATDGNRLRQTEKARWAAMEKISRLSSRERDVLDRVVQGMSNKEMAKALRISHRTVEIHRGHMMTKLNAQSAADAVRMALYAGLDHDFRFAA